MSKLQGPRILTADIETLPIDAHVWSLFDEPRALDRIIKDWAIFSAAAKWAHQKQVQYQDTRYCASPYDDRELLLWLRELLHEADIVVGQNVQKFDLRKIRARMIKHGIKPFLEPAVCDTMLMAKEVGSFTSNKLEYLSTLTGELKSKHSKYPGFALWRGILDDEEGAWREVKNYNKQDVKSTEKLYFALRPWTRRHPNVAQFYDDDLMRCGRCGSTHLIEQPNRLQRGVSTYAIYECNDCGGFSRGRFTLNSKDKRRNLLVCV